MKAYLRIDGKPTAKGRPRFYNGHAITPTATVNFENLIKQMWMVSRQKKLEGMLSLTIRAYFPIPKSYTKKKLKELEENNMYYDKKPDADNIAKTIDALNNMAFDDDSQIVKLQVEKFYSYDPRTEIELEELKHGCD